MYQTQSGVTATSSVIGGVSLGGKPLNLPGAHVRRSAFN